MTGTGKIPEVKIYTDGGCLNNPGPGGFRLTTNNRMEILAAIRGLDALKERCRVTIYSDSQYVVNAIEKGWALRWRSNGWRRNRTEKAVNPDLWEKLLDLCDRHEVRFQWIRGHAGTEENERADQLAKEAAAGENRDIDEIYEKTAGDDRI